MKILGKIGRALFLGAALVAGAGCGDSLEGKLGKGNEILRSFPDKSPNVDIVKYELPNSKYCIIQYAQSHNDPKGYKMPTKNEILSGEAILKSGEEKISPEEGINFMKEIYSKINNSQKRIYQFIDQHNSGVRDILMEGILENDDMEFMNDKSTLKKYYDITIDELLDSGFFDKNDLSKYKWIPGSGIILAREGKVNLFAAESEKARNNILESEEKEDNLLRLANQYGKPRIDTLYGRNHDLRDNILEWNNKHPDKKFSYIRVVPVWNN
jgi:hypothetical protein